MPIAIYFIVFAILSIRSASKAAWKTNDWGILMMYGIHSHLQQVPIYFGQLQYKWSRRRGKRLILFEYK